MSARPAVPAALLAAALAACGVKAAPRPPERHAPGAHPEPAVIPTTAQACGTCTVPSTPSPTAKGVR